MRKLARTQEKRTDNNDGDQNDMNTLKIPCKTGEISDGYHTFDELYEHRCTLFLTLMMKMPEASWFSEWHDDGSSIEGWFIAGINTPTGTVTYHLPKDMWWFACKTGAKAVSRAPKWDGHTSADVVKRLQQWIAA